MEQAVSKNVMSANKQKNKECFISDIPQRTLSAFQMGSRPSDRILFHNCTNHPARIADSHRVVRNIFNNNTAAANHNIASDRNPRHDMNARSDPNIAAHRDGIRIFQSLVAPLGINGVSCRVEAAVRCNKHIVTEGDLPAIQNHRVVICKEVFTDLNVIAVPPHHGSALYKRFLGYKKGTDGEPEIVPSEAAIVEHIFNLYLAGETVDNISKMMQAENYANATYKALMRATISEALGLNGDPEEVDMLERSGSCSIWQFPIKRIPSSKRCMKGGIFCLRGLEDGMLGEGRGGAKRKLCHKPMKIHFSS